MKRLALLMVLVFLSCAAFIGLALLVGQAQPIPPRVAVLHLTQCSLPCWIGIIPGTTTKEEAVEKVRKVYGKNVLAKEDVIENPIMFRIWNEDTPDNTVEVQLSNSTLHPNLIMAISFRFLPFLESDISVGEVYTILGPPDGITPYDSGDANFLYTHAECCKTLWVHAPNRIDFTQIPDELEIYLPDEDAATPIAARPWRGFTTLDRYMDWP